MDEFAFRKGCTSGSVLVDVEDDRVVDVLPDRTSYTFVAPFLQQRAGAGAGLVSVLQLIFSVAGILGNFAGGYLLGKSPRPTVLAVMALLGLSALALPLLGRWDTGAFLTLTVWGLAYGCAPVAMQTWLFNADPAAAGESGSGVFVATFQFSIAFGSFLGSGLSTWRASRPRCTQVPRSPRPASR